MSTLPITDDPEDIIYGDLLDEFLSLYQEILEENPSNNHEATKFGSEANVTVEAQQHLAIREEGTLKNNGLENSIKNSKRRKRNSINMDHEDLRNINARQISEEGPSSSVLNTKKLDHNAKERVRRMKVNASFLALRGLLPDHSRRSKKRLKAPAIIDGALKYIPELENELEELKFKKQKLKSDVNKNKKIHNNGNNAHHQHERCTVSVNKVNDQEEAIVQICMGRENELHQQGSGFANLLQRVEDEGLLHIISASTVFVCDTRTCYHLHIQMNQVSYDAIAELQEKIVSWLT